MKGKTIHFATGLVVGAVLFGGGAAVAAGILAQPSTQTFYLNGTQIQLQAYDIAGNNYVKLRDVGKAVDFGVSYDSATGSVRIDSESPYIEEVKPAAQGKNADGSINIPDGDAKLTLKVGDVVRCDDGTNYTITDMSRYDANAFASGPLPALPTPTCDWSSFPDVELPEVETRHFNNQYGDYLFIRNNYETRRMQYTIMNLAGNHPETSENGKLRYGPNNSPCVRIQLSIDAGIEGQSFWPWKPSQIEDDFNSVPVGSYAFEAWDLYRNGVFQYTEYKTYFR